MLDAKVTKKYIHLAQNHHAVQDLQKNKQTTKLTAVIILI